MNNYQQLQMALSPQTVPTLKLVFVQGEYIDGLHVGVTELIITGLQ